MTAKRVTSKLRTTSLATAALVAVATGLVIGTRTSSSHTRVLTPSTTVSRTRSLVASPAPSLVARSRPISLAIPSLNVDAPLVQLGLLANRQVQVPTTTTVAGWYRFGPTPGQMGSSVLLGHVDSMTGPGIFFQLKSLTPGDQVRVTLADGVVTRFVVQKVVQYTKSSFPDRLVYGSHGSPLLNLVTCGGAFDHATGHYLANIVVFTRFVSATKRHA